MWMYGHASRQASHVRFEQVEKDERPEPLTQLAPLGIRVVVVEPGLIETAFGGSAIACSIA
jgi:hypothetical protein